MNGHCASGHPQLAFSPDGSRLLVGSWGAISNGNPPVLWDVSNGVEIARLSGHKSDTQPQGVIVQSRWPPDCDRLARRKRTDLGRQVGSLA